MSRLVAHRGQRYTIPENTIESIQAAINCGATAVEFDIQMTSDGVPVLAHDLSLSITAGIDINISEINYTDVKLHSVNETARFGDSYQDVSLPSLQKMVALLKHAPQVTAFVELKDASIDVFGLDNFLPSVLQHLQPIESQCIIIADSLQALLASKKISQIPVGWITHHWHVDNLTQAKQSQLDYMVINHEYCEGHDHDYAADDWEWVMYETRDTDKAKELFERGVRFVESDDICAMLKQLPEYK